jgi:hypothetical protein
MKPEELTIYAAFKALGLAGAVPFDNMERAKREAKSR